MSSQPFQYRSDVLNCVPLRLWTRVTSFPSVDRRFLIAHAWTHILSNIRLRASSSSVITLKSTTVPDRSTSVAAGSDGQVRPGCRLQHADCHKKLTHPSTFSQLDCGILDILRRYVCRSDSCRNIADSRRLDSHHSGSSHRDSYH